MSRRRLKIAAPIDDDKNRWSLERVQRYAQAGQTVPRKERLEVRQSPVHGRGIFARIAIPAGNFILHYAGRIIDWDEAMRRHPHDPSQPNHTFYFSLDDTFVIDGNDGGNRARWINHSCAPNCESEIKGQRVYLRSLRDIQAGEELSFDYNLMLDEPITPELKNDYLCLCGSPQCRHTMLNLDEA